MIAIDWKFLPELYQGISSLSIIFPKMNISNVLQVNLESVRWCICIWWSLPKTIKPNVFRIPFCDQTAMIATTLFEHVLQIVCLYLIMWVQLKWVGSNKMLEYVFCLMDIHVNANVRSYYRRSFGCCCC